MPAIGTAEAQALNRAAVAEAVANLNKVVQAAMGPGSDKGLTRVGLDLVNEIKRQLSKPGGGRTYTRRGRSGTGSVTHTASSPGAPPAVDTGRLRASIAMKAGSEKGHPFVDVGTNVEYAPFLEFGTSRMAARPFIKPAVVAVTEAIRKTIGEGIVASEVAAIHTLPPRTV